VTDAAQLWCRKSTILAQASRDCQR